MVTRDAWKECRTHAGMAAIVAQYIVDKLSVSAECASGADTMNRPTGDISRTFRDWITGVTCAVRARCRPYVLAER